MSKEKKKLPKGCMLIPVIVFALLIIWFLIENTAEREKLSSDTEKYKTEWYTLSPDVQIKWMKSYFEQNAFDADPLIANVLKKQFEYGENVKFENYPSLKNADILASDSGLAIVRGFCIAPNGFNVKKGFGYEVRLIARPDTFYFKNVKTWEFQ